MSVTSATDYFGVAPIPPEYVEVTFYSAEQSGASMTHIFNNNGPAGARAIVDQIEVVVSGGSGPQLICEMYGSVSQARFFYDSQSIGQANGIRFIWRGRRPVGTNNQLYVYVHATAAANVQCGCEIRGYWAPKVMDVGFLQPGNE